MTVDEVKAAARAEIRSELVALMAATGSEKSGAAGRTARIQDISDDMAFWKNPTQRLAWRV